MDDVKEIIKEYFESRQDVINKELLLSEAKKDLEDAKTRQVKAVENMEKNYLETGETKITYEGLTVTPYYQSGFKSVEISCSPEDLPEEYQKVKITANKEKIKKDMLEGKLLNYASLSRGNNVFKIKVS